ncbi:hypothetical protein [Roseomonas sp. WA12]
MTGKELFTFSYRMARLLHRYVEGEIKSRAIYGAKAAIEGEFDLLAAAAKKASFSECNLHMTALRNHVYRLESFESEDWPERADEVCEPLLDAPTDQDFMDELRDLDARMGMNLTAFLVQHLPDEMDEARNRFPREIYENDEMSSDDAELLDD